MGIQFVGFYSEIRVFCVLIGFSAEATNFVE